MNLVELEQTLNVDLREWEQGCHDIVNTISCPQVVEMRRGKGGVYEAASPRPQRFTASGPIVPLGGTPTQVFYSLLERGWR